MGEPDDPGSLPESLLFEIGIRCQVARHTGFKQSSLDLAGRGSRRDDFGWLGSSAAFNLGRLLPPLRPFGLRYAGRPGHIDRVAPLVERVIT